MTGARITCISCPLGCRMDVVVENGEVRVTGNTCKRGAEYAKTEAIAPRRTLTTTVRGSIGGRTVIAPVRTKGDIPKGLLFEAMGVINGVRIDREMPLGAVVVENLLGTGVDVVLTDDVG